MVSVVMGIALMMDNSAHSFEMEVARREILRCDNIQHMRGICLSILDLLEGQKEFFLDQILSERRL